MHFEDLHLSEIRSVVYYRPNILTWTATDRKDHIIGVNISGVAYHDLGYKHINLEPDFLYFFNQKDDFRAVTAEIGYCYSIHFTTTEPIDTPSFCRKISNTDELVRMIERIERLWLQKDGARLLLRSEFYRFCDTLNKLQTAPYTPRDPKMTAAKEYIDLHFKEKDCLHAAVELKGLTQRRFNDLFKSHFHTTPNQYVLSKRIEYASRLLEIGDLSITEIAELSGFSDVYYFSKQFKNKTGMSPLTFKRGNRT